MKSFNEKGFYSKVSDVLNKKGGLTCDRLAFEMKINVGIMKELIDQAELLGFICIDESDEGFRYYPNLFKWLKEKGYSNSEFSP